MSEFWKSFKNVFVQDDPNAAATQKDESNNAPNYDLPPMKGDAKTSAPQKVTPSVSFPLSPSGAGGGTVSEKFMQALSGAMEAANLDGFDYFEFKQALANLKNVPIDEPTRYKSAFAMSQAMGVTAGKLQSTAQHYLDVLQNERSKFNQAADNQRNTQVGSKQSEVQNLETMMQQKAEMIQKLTAEIAQHRQDVEKIKTDIAQATVKVEQTQRDFEATYNAVVGQIQADAQNMKNYL